jgi:hypothetical protein
VKKFHKNGWYRDIIVPAVKQGRFLFSVPGIFFTMRVVPRISFRPCMKFMQGFLFVA